MTSLIISVYAIVLMCINGASAEIKCGVNEYVDECPRNCAYDYCPTDERHDKAPCYKPSTCPAPACKCIFNHRRDKNNTCIPTEECPAFKCSRPKEVFDPCPSYCPGDDCSNATPTGECPFLSLLVVTCSPTCKCIPHHWRKDGKCVPYLECPGVKNKLNKDENLDIGIPNFFLK